MVEADELGVVEEFVDPVVARVAVEIETALELDELLLVIAETVVLTAVTDEFIRAAVVVVRAVGTVVVILPQTRSVETVGGVISI